MGISDDDSMRLRAAAMDKALAGDVGGALDIAAIHDVVTGKSGKGAGSGKGGSKSGSGKGGSQKRKS